MKKKSVVLIILIWILYQIIAYYFIPYYLVPILWILISITLLWITIIQLVKLIKERKDFNKWRVYKLGLFTVLFIFTFNRTYVEQVLEKTDWLLLYNQRNAIVEQVKNKELNPNVSWNDVLCELPFEFPVVSNGGNDIMIFRNDKAITVKFWTYRNFFSAPSTYFIYTNDADEMKGIEAKVRTEPLHNWKIEEHWYRVYENN